MDMSIRRRRPTRCGQPRRTAREHDQCTLQQDVHRECKLTRLLIVLAMLIDTQKFAFWALVTIVILQALLFSIAIAQWVISLWSNTKREFGDDRPDTGTEMESQRDLKISEEFPKQQY